MKKFIKLPNSIESVEEKLTMAALLMSAKNDNETITTISVLEALLTKKAKPNKKIQDVIFSGLKSLIENGLVKVDIIPNRINDLFEATIFVQEETFTILFYEEIQLIMNGNYKGAVNRELFGYYSVLASFYNNNTKVAYPSIEQLSEKAGVHVKTVEKYNKVLKELEIIHVENNGLITNQDGIQSLKNTYSRKVDAVLCKTEAEKYRDKVAKVTKGKLVQRKPKVQQVDENNEVLEDSNKNMMDDTQNIAEDFVKGLEDSSNQIKPNLQQSGFGITDLNIEFIKVDPDEFVQEVPMELDRIKSFKELQEEMELILEQTKHIIVPEMPKVEEKPKVKSEYLKQLESSSI